LLAGPIVRRAETERVCIWLATSEPRDAHVEVFAAGGAISGSLGSGLGKRVELGPRLFIHLVEVRASGGLLPANELLTYDLRLQGGELGDTEDLEAMGLLDGPDRITYGEMPLPSFHVSRARTLNVMHGSCRLLHGGGEDAFMAADEAIAATATDVSERPSALFLTGDQIYADDVAAPLIGHIRSLATTLLGPGDLSSVPGSPPLDSLSFNGRRDLATEIAGFTSEKPENHLMSLGEFAAMYLTTWNPEVWPRSFAARNEAIPDDPGPRRKVVRERLRYSRQVRKLQRARAALPAVRRVLANVPTYMMFDDHDVTDDWNLTGSWRERVRTSATGRRVVANALASFWAFQGWGNDPDDIDLTEPVSSFVSNPASEGSSFEEAMWDFDRWSFFVPAEPPTVVMDTRTRRHYDDPDGGARLVSKDELHRVAELARKAGHERGRPLILVSAVPVFGYEFQERRQKYLLDKLGPYEIDFEAWHSNLRGIVDLMRMLIEELRPSPCVILSGDVHYGVNAEAFFEIGDQELQIVQLVSSGLKHAARAAKVTLNSVGRLLSRKHERLGWEKPPRAKVPTAEKVIAKRPVNVDEWAEDSPIFLAPRHVKALGIETPPDYRECRIYVRPEGRTRSILIGENNVGIASITGDEVIHRILTRGAKGTRVNRAKIRPSSGHSSER
jgi:hypothetical protein